MTLLESVLEVVAKALDFIEWIFPGVAFAFISIVIFLAGASIYGEINIWIRNKKKEKTMKEIEITILEQKMSKLEQEIFEIRMKVEKEKFEIKTKEGNQNGIYE